MEKINIVNNKKSNYSSIDVHYGMKKIILGLALLIYFFIPEKTYSQNKKIFCLDITENKAFIIQEETALAKISGDRCKGWQKKYFSTPYPFEVVETSEKEYENFKKNNKSKSSSSVIQNFNKTASNNNAKTTEDKKYIYDLFNKAFKESEEARDYCKKIHTANLTIKSLTKLETCYSDEKLKIYSKYNLSYGKIVKILEREYLDLYENARSFVESVFLGSSSSTAAKEKAYNDNIYLIRSRAQDQINKEEEYFAAEFAKAERARDKSPGADESKASKKGASGSAFFINSKGSIITNNHVVEVCSGNIKIIHNKKEITAQIIAKDEKLDLAVLSSNIKPQQFIKLSKKSGEKLDKVVTAGYPLGYKISDELKFTSGIVSATKGWKDNINEFQIDAALNPGNSGGPVVNDAGNLFGVAVAGLTDRQNLNFAIKSKAVKDFLDVNKISYSTATVEFDMDNKKRLKLLEDSTVFIYCN